MKVFSLSLLLSFCCLITIQAQEKPYRKEKMNVMGNSYKGYSVELPFGLQKSHKYLITYLQDNGKISEKRNFIEIKETYWKSKEDPTKVYAMINGDTIQSRIWIGYSPEASEKLIYSLEGQMESLPFLMHKQHLQAQIKEAEDALSYLSRELKNTDRDGRRLDSSLKQNTEEKIKLEQALDQNAQDKIQLEKEKENNEKVKEDQTQALEEVKMQLEHLKERLSKL